MSRCTRPKIEEVRRRPCGCLSYARCACGYEARLPEDHHLDGCRDREERRRRS